MEELEVNRDFHGDQSAFLTEFAYVYSLISSR